VRELGVRDVYRLATLTSRAPESGDEVPKKPRRTYLDGSEAITALLDAARELDGRDGARTSGRHALVATLLFAGLRASEAAALRGRDVNLAAGRLKIEESKTDAGAGREIVLAPVLLSILKAHKGETGFGPDDPVFPTAAGPGGTRTTSGRACWRPS